MTEKEKRLRQELDIEYDMLKGNINRMYTCDSVSELLDMYRWANMRLAKICELRQERLKENEPASAPAEIGSSD